MPDVFFFDSNAKRDINLHIIGKLYRSDGENKDNLDTDERGKNKVDLKGSRGLRDAGTRKASRARYRDDLSTSGASVWDGGGGGGGGGGAGRGGVGGGG